MSTSTDPIEHAKRAAADLAVKHYFPSTATYIGIGSGSTIKYVVKAIQALNNPAISSMLFVPTGYQSRRVILDAKLKDIRFDSLPKGTLMDVAFDGADEVDEDLNCIKGGGACMYQEKLVATHAKKFVCVADHRKLRGRLLTDWPTIPIEVEPLAVASVSQSLELLGSKDPKVREGSMLKAGPIKTDQDNFIIDAPFEKLLLKSEIEASKSLHPTHHGVEGKGEDGRWEVETLAKEIKGIEGVLSVGIFCGEDGEQVLARGGKTGGQKPVAAYFGMEDGSVTVRRKGEDGKIVETNEGS